MLLKAKLPSCAPLSQALLVTDDLISIMHTSDCTVKSLPLESTVLLGEKQQAVKLHPNFLRVITKTSAINE